MAAVELELIVGEYEFYSMADVMYVLFLKVIGVYKIPTNLYSLYMWHVGM